MTKVISDRYRAIGEWLAGQKVGRFTVVGLSEEKTLEKSRLWVEAVCACGKQIPRDFAEINNDRIKTCVVKGWCPYYKEHGLASVQPAPFVELPKITSEQRSKSAAIGHRTNAQEAIGKKFECLTCIGFDGKSHDMLAMFFRCDCDNVVSKILTQVKQKRYTHCEKGCEERQRLKKEYLNKTINELAIREIVRICKTYASGENITNGFLCECSCTNTTIVRARDVLNGSTKSCGHLHAEYAAGLVGANNPNWKNNATTEAQAVRSSNAYRDWQKAVFARDNCSCRRCGYRSNRYERLNAHHILNFASHKELRLDVGNGITYCYDCHKKFHSEFGRMENNQEQVNQFLATPFAKEYSEDTDDEEFE